tara:strand:+ start:3416 stop:3892 length:477 start_codon:yes stop_codon:yes gene_type:complete
MEANQSETTVYKLLEAFTVYGEKNTQINSTVIGPIDEMDVKKMNATLFPCLFVNLTGGSIDKGEAEISVEVIIATLQPNDLKDRAWVISNMFYMIKDVIALGHNHAYDDNKFIPRATMELPVGVLPFNVRFENQLIGWSADMNFSVDNTNDVCLIPMT